MRLLRSHRHDPTKRVAGGPSANLAEDPFAATAGLHCTVTLPRNGKERFLKAVTELPKAFALVVPYEEALTLRDEVAFLQAVQAVLSKRAPYDGSPEEPLDHATHQIITRAIAPEGVVDIFAAAPLAKPEISIRSDEFLAEGRQEAPSLS